MRFRFEHGVADLRSSWQLAAYGIQNAVTLEPYARPERWTLGDLSISDGIGNLADVVHVVARIDVHFDAIVHRHLRRKQYDFSEAIYPMLPLFSTNHRRPVEERFFFELLRDLIEDFTADGRECNVIVHE